MEGNAFSMRIELIIEKSVFDKRRGAASPVDGRMAGGKKRKWKTNFMNKTVK